ncbi:MAG TPA: hypothetical protein VJB14_06985, partial [Planctomycetota bacterium]|nr:hypothetical protein [Planctomycetota bacterium]
MNPKKRTVCFFAEAKKQTVRFFTCSTKQTVRFFAFAKKRTVCFVTLLLAACTTGVDDGHLEGGLAEGFFEWAGVEADGADQDVVVLPGGADGEDVLALLEGPRGEGPGHDEGVFLLVELAQLLAVEEDGPGFLDVVLPEEEGVFGGVGLGLEAEVELFPVGDAAREL